MIRVQKGNSPLIICLPHTGTEIPPAIESRMSATGRLQTDMSWHLEQVFDLAEILDATIISSSISKLVVDIDHTPDDFSIGKETSSSTCPTLTLDGKRIYKFEEEPGPTEQEQRVLLFHDPFHRAVRAEISRLKKMHRNVAIFDCQSMRSRIKGFCERGLPMVSLGTVEGKSCSSDLKELFTDCFAGLTGFSIGVDDLFTGGYITRTYGEPRKGVHAITVMIAQRSYLRHETPPFEPDKVRVARMNSTMSDAFSRVIKWAEEKGGNPIPSKGESTLISKVKAELANGAAKTNGPSEGLESFGAVTQSDNELDDDLFVTESV